MAIRHAYTLLCEHVLNDVSGKTSYINSFANLKLDEIPGRLAVFYVVVGLSGDPGEEFSASIVGPDRKRLIEFYRGEIPVYEADDPNRVTFALLSYPLLNFTFASPGVHEVVVKQGSRVVHRQPFGVDARGESR